MLSSLLSIKQWLFIFLFAACFLKQVHSQVTQLFEHPPHEQVVRLYLLFNNNWIQKDSVSLHKTIDSITTVAKQNGEKKLIWYSEVFKVRYFALRQNGQSDQETAFVNKLEYFDGAPFKEISGTYNFFVGHYYYENKQFEKAFHHLVKANDIFESIGYQNVPLAAKISSDLFGFYYRFEDYKTALAFLDLTIKYSDSLLSYPVFDLNNKGVTYHKMKNLAQAKETFLQVLNNAKATNDSAYIGIGSGNYGNMLRLEGKYAESLPYLYTDLQLNQKRVPDNSAIGCLYIAYSLLRLDSVEKAAQYLDLSLQLQPDWQWSSFGPNYYETKALYFQKTGNFRLASTYKDSLLYLRDSLKNLFSTRILMATSLKFKEEKMLADKKKAATEADNIRMVRNLVILILFFAFISVLILFNHKRNREKMLFVEKQRESDELLCIAQIKLEQYITGIKEKTSLIENIGLQLTSVAAGKNEIDSELTRQIQKLNESVILTEDDWNAFKNLFSEVWPQFFEQLQYRYPDLSQSEIRLLALCKLQLSSRVMANMIGISIDSLRKSRYRLRKKHPELLLDDEFKEVI